ncbi:MAG: hypothetical protein ACKO6A_02420 [Bacteroidota bacterium]
MKSIFFSFLFSALALTSYSQENVTIGKSQTVSELAQSKNNGVYTFYFPTSITKEKIMAAAKYYPDYFSYTINEKENSVKIQLVENTEINRRIITRFLVSVGLQKIEVDKNELLIHEFFESYLK